MIKCEQCIIRKLNSLKELTKEEVIRVSNCKTSRIVKKGEIIFNEGEYVNGVFCIKAGVCKVSKLGDNGREQIIHLIKKGDLLGERSLINDEVSNLKATAITDIEVCFIPKKEILKDLENNHKFTMGVLKNMASSLKNADNFIVGMAQKTVKQRLAHLLVYLNANFKSDEEGAINIHLSREDIANTIGTVTESAIRLLSEFKKEKLIDLKGKKIFIRELSRLKKN
jgi:CRP-like cAMP-binding protein